MRVWLPEQDGALALHRSECCPSADRRSSAGSTASTGADTASLGVIGGRYCTSVGACASPFPTEILQVRELLPSPAAQVQHGGRLQGSLQKLEGWPRTKEHHRPHTEVACC